jgi:D-sedoheptulose 7-phosphate isomerase
MSDTDAELLIHHVVSESLQVKTQFFAENSAGIIQAADAMVRAYRDGKKLLLFGNGGSAADAQHIAAEFVVRYIPDRKALPALALSTDTSILTSASNDHGYSTIFSRQIDALGVKGDVAIAISTSGNSPSVLEGIDMARSKGLFVLGFTGKTGGQMARRTDLLFRVPSTVTPRIQEAHILLGHILCELVDRSLFPDLYPKD